MDTEGRLEQQSDGLYARYLPAKLLQEMNIVDTPGEALEIPAFGAFRLLLGP